MNEVNKEDPIYKDGMKARQMNQHILSNPYHNLNATVEKIVDGQKIANAWHMWLTGYIDEDTKLRTGK